MGSLFRTQENAVMNPRFEIIIMAPVTCYIKLKKYKNKRRGAFQRGRKTSLEFVAIFLVQKEITK